MSTVNTGTFTYELTNDAMTLVSNDGVKAISILCTSTVSGTITGTANIGRFSSAALTIAQNESVTYSSQVNGCIEGLTITAPASCTLQIIAQK